MKMPPNNLVTRDDIRQIAESLTEEELTFLREGAGPAAVAQSIMGKTPEGTSLVELLDQLLQLLEADAKNVRKSPWQQLVEDTAEDALALCVPTGP